MQNRPPEDPQSQTTFTSSVNSSSGPQSPIVNPPQPANQHAFFYTQDQEDDLDLHLPLVDEQDHQEELSSPFVLPFQNSTVMPTLAQRQTQDAHGSVGTPPSSTSPTKKRRWGSSSLVKILLLISVVLITMIGASLFVFAQSALSPRTTQVSETLPAQETSANTKRPTSGSSPQPAATLPSRQEQGTSRGNISSSEGVPSAQLLLQIGWTQAGLSFADALEALRTGTTFTDREMSYDYRNIGSLVKHGGTLTNSTFLLTPGGQIRFAQNDVRIINNVLYNKVRNGKIIQQVVNAHASLVHFQIVQIQGQQRKFAWVDVAFELFQSKSDPASGKRTESLELDPTTGQPAIHHMVIVLVRVPPQNQGINAPMGGTGWLVDTYELDTHTLPAIATTPSL